MSISYILIKSCIGIEDISKYPNVSTHLLRFKEKLENRQSFGKIFKDTNKSWFEMWHPNRSMPNPKILTPDISKTNNFACDLTGDIYTLKTGIILALREKI